MRSYLDHGRRRSSGETPVDTFPDVAGDEGSVAERCAERLTLLEALRTLEPRDRAIVVLRYWDDLSIEQVADTLGVTVNVVRIRAGRALQRLRPLLAETQAPALSERAPGDRV